MTAERKKWWRKVALASVGGTVAMGGLFGIVRATAPQDKKPVAPVAGDVAWTRAPVAESVPVAPVVSEVERAPEPPGSIVPAGALLPVPVPALPAPVAPAGPSTLPVPPAIEPVGSGPRTPDAGLIGSEKIPLPPVPSLPPVGPPKGPDAPKGGELPKPADAMAPALPGLPAPGDFPALPPLPIGATESPKVTAAPPPAIAPGTPVAPPVKTAPSLPSVKSADPVPPALPAKPNSDLKGAKPENTLNLTPPVAPAVPVGFPPAPTGGREVPGATVDRAKPPEPAFGASDKSVSPVPFGPNPLAVTPRDPAMFNLKRAAAVAVIGGAMLSAEQARSAAPAAVPPVAVPAAPSVPVRADDKVTPEQLKKDLEAANARIAALEKQVADLTKLVTGKKDSDGRPLTNKLDRGAIADVAELKDQVEKLETELRTLKSQQTVLKPAVPEAKPKGIVRVVNEYPVEISMVINDKSHRIAPSTKIDVEVPAGDFSYQLLQSGAPATRSVIKDKETVTLRIK